MIRTDAFTSRIMDGNHFDSTSTCSIYRQRCAALDLVVESFRVLSTHGDLSTSDTFPSSAPVASYLITGMRSSARRSLDSRSAKPAVKRKWYTWIGRGMYLDVKRRIPYIKSDWTDAWNYRVIPATFVSVFS